MKALILVTSLVLLIATQSIREGMISDIVEVPIHLVNGYGPFSPDFAILSLRKADYVADSEVQRIKGIPDAEGPYILKRIIIDYSQFVHQELGDSAWNLSYEELPHLGAQVSVDPIKCFVNVLFAKSEGGELSYLLDTDNDWDFSDEKATVPPVITPSIDLDSLSQLAPEVPFEIIVNHKKEKVLLPILIAQSSFGFPMYNIPVHFEATFQNKTLLLSSGFGRVTFKEGTTLYLRDPLVSSSPEKVERGEFFKIEDQVYKNQGASYKHQVLQVEKIPEDTPLYSTQMGYLAPPFRGVEFSRGDSLHLTDYQGKFLFLDFWGTWCAGCIKDLPYLQLAFHEVDPEKIAFLGIALDEAEDLRRMLDKKEIPWAQIRSSEKAGSIIDRYNVVNYPSNFLIDPSGKIVAKNLRGERLTDTLKTYLE